MVNKVLNAVTKQLGTTFGSSYHYYVENVEQDLVKPCFTVDLLLPQKRSKMVLLHDRTMPLVIHHFRDSEPDLKKKLYDMGEQIVDCLEYLPFMNSLIRGEDISWQVKDDVLQIFITYKFTTMKINTMEENMETLNEVVSHKS